MKRSKYMVRRPLEGGQGWRTFLANHAGEIVAIELSLRKSLQLVAQHGRSPQLR